MDYEEKWNELKKEVETKIKHYKETINNDLYDFAYGKMRAYADVLYTIWKIEGWYKR